MNPVVRFFRSKVGIVVQGVDMLGNAGERSVRDPFSVVD